MDRFQRLRERLVQGGFAPSEASWGGTRVLTGQKRTFKWRWFATALWENVVAFEAKAVDVPELTAMIDQAKHWAIANKRGTMRGMQSGQAIVVVVLADKVTDAARALARKSWNIEFARFTVVAVTDGKDGTIAKGPRAIGVIYRPHLTNRMRMLITA